MAITGGTLATIDAHTTAKVKIIQIGNVVSWVFYQNNLGALFSCVVESENAHNKHVNNNANSSINHLILGYLVHT